MVGTEWDQLVGAAGDLRELEYVTALMQTGANTIRNDCTLQAQDIRLYLSSRFGVRVTDEHLRDTIFKGFGDGTVVDAATGKEEKTYNAGRRSILQQLKTKQNDPDELSGGDGGDDHDGSIGKEEKHPQNIGSDEAGGGGDDHDSEKDDVDTDDDDDDNDGGTCLDLMQILSILLIPTLLKAVHSEYELRGSNRSSVYDSSTATQSQSSNVETTTALNDRELIPTPRGMLDYVLKMILHDTTGSSVPKKLDTALLKTIFTAYGETEIASNQELLQEMVECASDDDDTNEKTTPSKSSTSPLQVLDVHAFSRALTHDIQLYDINNERRWTTNYQDVFGEVSGKNNDTKNLGSHQKQQKNETHQSGCKEGESDVERSAPPVPALSTKKEDEEVVSYPVERRFTAPSIDITAGTHRSKGLMVFLWSFVLISFFDLLMLLREFNSLQYCIEQGHEYDVSVAAPWSHNSEAIGCECVVSIVYWIFLFFVLSIFGFVAVSLGSLGNHFDSPIWKPFVAGSALTVYLYGSNQYYYQLQDSDDEENVNGSIVYEYGALVYNDKMTRSYMFIIGTILVALAIVLHISHIVSILFSRSARLLHWAQVRPRVQRLLTTSQIVAEMYIKRACSLKMANMTRNALKIVRVNDHDKLSLNSHYAQALDEYSRFGAQYRPIGGFLWTWRRILSGKLYEKDGIWISTRLIASNIGQCIVPVWILLAGIKTIQNVSEAYDSESAREYFRSFVNRTVVNSVNDEVVSDFAVRLEDVLKEYIANTTVSSALYCSDDSYGRTICGFQSGNSNASLDDVLQRYAAFGSSFSSSGANYEWLEEQSRRTFEAAIDTTFNTLYPSQKYMVMVPLISALVVAVATSLFLAASYMPSVVTSILQLRVCGLQTLQDNRYREAPDQVAILTGGLFWGSFLSSLLSGGLVGVILFFFLWQATAYIAQRLVATIIGVIAITLIRLLIVISFRCRLYAAFYRQKPATANMTMLGLEWATFGLSVGFVVARILKLAFVTTGFIGRIDRPLLAEGVGRIGKLELDAYPMVHRKDLLSHEAHRHPLIELMGTMFLMKLRYGNSFGKTCGSCWRLLFTYALFPWVNLYRIQRRVGLVDENALNFSVSKLQLQFVSLPKLYGL